MTETLPQPSHGEFIDKVHILPIRVYYEDTDFTGLVYHANYVRYFERGRSNFLRAAGLAHQSLLELDPPLGFTILHMSLDFEKAAHIDDALIVKTIYRGMKGAKVIFDQSVWRGEKRLCKADIHACMINMQGRPVRPVKALVAQLDHFIIPQ